MPTPEDNVENPGDAFENHSEQPRSFELQSFEARLAQFVPRSDRLDRDRLVFLAGQASLTSRSPGGSPPDRDWRCHRGWPAAFAVMSALAASLLAMLIMRPVVTSELPSASRTTKPGDQFATSSPPMVSRPADGRSSTISPRDAFRGDIEELLATRSQENATWPHDVIHDPSPALTPSAWQRVSEEMQPPAPPAGSSSIRFLRGVNS